MNPLNYLRRKLGALLRLLIPVTLLAGCSGMRQPSPADLADYEAVARLTAYVACQEVSEALKRDERAALHGSLMLVRAGLDSGRLGGLDGTLEALGLRDQGHRLLVAAALQLAAGRIPEDVREHYATAVTLAAVVGCTDGVAAGGAL